MRVIISGAGIAGLALAQSLDAAGADVTIVEKASGPRRGGYMIDFFGPGYDAAEAMGVLPRIRELGYRVDEVAYVDESGRARARLQLRRFARAAGGRLISVLRPDLEQALRERVTPRVDVRFGTVITAVDDSRDGVTVTLSDGATRTGDLLVGCDGIHSSVRALVFGPEKDFVRPLGLATAAFTFRDPRVQEEVGGRFVLTDTLQRSMGFYGLRDGRVAAFAVHRSDGAAVPEDPCVTLRREYGSLGWIVPRALAACPEREQVYYDVVAQVVAPSWSRGRVALLGDAGYAVSLLAGQGASLAVAGAYLLATELARRPSVPAALEAYESAFRPVVSDRQEAGRNGALWFAPENRRQLWVRRAALAVSRVPFIDRLVATGLAGKPTALIAGLTALRAPDGLRMPTPPTRAPD